MRHLPLVCSLGALAVCSTKAISAKPDERQIVIADEVRTAFYEHAPSSMAREMSAAVLVWCEQFRDPNGDSSPPKQHQWLCGTYRLEYFRGVYVTGDRGPRGLVCERSGTTELRYFGQDLVNDLLEDGSCVAAHRSSKATYELYVPVKTHDGDA